MFVFKDIPLLKQFICPFTGKVIEPVKTGKKTNRQTIIAKSLLFQGVCRSQQKKLVAAIEKARDIGKNWNTMRQYLHLLSFLLGLLPFTIQRPDIRQ